MRSFVGAIGVSVRYGTSPFCRGVDLVCVAGVSSCKDSARSLRLWVWGDV